MSNPLISKAEQHAYRQLFLHDLNWSAPDHTPIDFTTDGRTLTATNVSSYKGLRVWVCDEKPGSQLEALLDREIAKTSTDRLVIFHDRVDQVWRWPVRRTKDAATTTRLTSHRHHTGVANSKFEARLDAIRLPLDKALDPNAVLAKVRAAFDVETQNETKQASKLMARMYAAMEKTYPSDHDPAARDHQISVTLARILFLIFGDDTDMWTADLFRDFIHNHTAADGSDIGSQLNDLFVYLDTAPAERHDVAAFKDFPYVNGGIFLKEPVALPNINAEFRIAVLDACAVDWSTISPAIFGSMFQSVRDAKTRHELGEHYTSEENILKTLNPLFLDQLRADFEHARTMRNETLALTRLWERLGTIRYMDPACGCGNFIIVAYRELRDLELAIMERLQDISGDVPLGFDPTIDLKITLDHFCGIEIDEWPAKIAETAMFLIDRQCDLKLKERFGEAPQRLPIQQQAKIVVANALRSDWNGVCPSTRAVIVAGNPPFLGHNSRTAEQAQELRDLWKRDDIGRLDYATGWYAKALDYFSGHAGRWAFVSTNSVVQGEPVATLFREVFRRGWRIRFAHRTFAWESEAVGAATVHCVILGFDRDEGTPPRLFDYDARSTVPREVRVKRINAYLTDSPNVLVEQRRSRLSSQLSTVSFGSRPNDGGNLVVGPDQHDLIAADPIARKYLRRFVGSKELLHNIDRWCLWLLDVTDVDLARSPILTQRVEGCRQHRLSSKRPATREWAQWPHLFDFNSQPSTPYLCIPGVVSEHRPFFTAARFEPEVIASNLVFTTADPDGFQFAIVSSSMFITWQLTIGGRLESRPRFSNTVVWNNLPLPPVDVELRRRIIAAGRQVEEARASHPELSLADLYVKDAMKPDLVEAHAALDELVDHAFGANATCGTERERQQLLFTRYEELSSPLFASAPKGHRRK